MTSDIHLCLFLSRATPLSRWDRLGTLQREIAIYKKMRPALAGISIVTSGGVEELNYQTYLPDINILYNRWGFSPNLYSLLAPLLHWRALRRATIYKTNQLDGAWTAILAGILHRKKIVVRAGYLWAEFNEQEKVNSLKVKLMKILQRFTFRQADHIFITTVPMQQSIQEKYDIPPQRITVIPNFVDTDIWCPSPEKHPPSHRLCYVGRLHPRKNLHLIMPALGRIPQASLVLIGQGEQQTELADLAKEHGAAVQFVGVLPHEKIPSEIHRSDIFILPSKFEGHPKALIEAMACGAAVIGTNVPGVREFVVHGETGWLCEPTVDSLQEGIAALLAQPALRAELGKNARQYILEHFCLDRVAQLELATFAQVNTD